jgi:hypothetical protein
MTGLVIVRPASIKMQAAALWANSFLLAIFKSS